MNNFLYLKKVARGLATLLLVAGISITPGMLESSSYAESLWNRLPARPSLTGYLPSGAAQKATELRQKAMELAASKGAFRTALVLVGLIGAVGAWWLSGLFGGPKQGGQVQQPSQEGAERRAKEEFATKSITQKDLEQAKKQFIEDMLADLQEMIKKQSKLYNQWSAAFREKFKLQGREELLYLTHDIVDRKNNIDAILGFFSWTMSNSGYTDIRDYIDNMIFLIEEIQDTLAKKVIENSPA